MLRITAAKSVIRKAVQSPILQKCWSGHQPIRTRAAAATTITTRRFATDSLLSSIQSGLQTVQAVSGLPWWATIGASTLMVRTSLFPLIRYQIIATRKLTNAMPEINFLFQLLRNRLKHIPSSDSSERRKIISVFFKGVRACLALYEVNLFEILVYPLINIAAFVTFVYSIRDMVANGAPELGLEEGGGLWFKDLSEKDKTFGLPLAAISLSYLALEVAFASANGKLILLFKDGVQSLLLLSMPFITSLPSGVFCYWIPSSLFGIAQSFALKSISFQKFLRLPPPPNKKR